MHLLIILAFAILLWRAEESDRWLMTNPDHPLPTILAVMGLPVATVVCSWFIQKRGLRQLAHGQSPNDVHHWLQRSTIVLRSFQLAAFGALIFVTHWPVWLAFGQIHPALQFVGDLIVLVPYLLSLVLVWVVTFPLENELRLRENDSADAVGWRLGQFLDFHLRHFVIVIVVPMTFILLASGWANGYEDSLSTMMGTKMAPNIIVGLAAALVYLVFPLMLRFIWRMESLPRGEMRTRLEQLCERIDLRCRDILVWKSDGVMINAAVMGLVPQVRYVLLSDALLSTMSNAQVEGVFGHEAGHIRKRHIHLFLLFAFLGWLVTGIFVEGLSILALQFAWTSETVTTGIQLVGLLITVLFWAWGFGMLSRRFERQADLFGARCITAAVTDCGRACSVHQSSTSAETDPREPAEESDRVCAAGASVFASALDRVSRLNGIPQDEWHWRYDSIGDRIRFLHATSGDPGLAESFESRLRMVGRGITAVAVIGGLVAVIYLALVGEPAFMRLLSGQEPEKGVSVRQADVMGVTQAISDDQLSTVEV
ncbi:MAG: M48 family metallopeptidase [Phycisphaerae bacterium]